MLHNLEAEQSVLGAVLLDNDCLETFMRLTEAHFYSPAHKIIYQAICYLTNKNVAVDLVTLADRLKSIGKLEAVGGNEYLAGLIDALPSTANFKHYVSILRKEETLRRLANAAAQISDVTNKADDEDKALQQAEKLIFDISKERERKELTKLGAELPTIMENFDLVAHNPAALRGLQTGFTELDGITNGLQKTNLIIIGARPGIGKSSLALNIALNAALKNKAKVAIFSLEMSKREVATRALCSVARVSLSRASRGNLTPDEWSKLWAANEKLQSANIFVDDTSAATAEEVTRKCLRLQREQGLDLVLVDYLGLMGDSKSANKNDNRQVQVAHNCWLMKALAKDLDVPVLLLAQLNREIESQARKKGDVEPVLSDLRESGSIEQNADVVLFIHKPKVVSETPVDERNRDYEAKIIVAKHRNGRTGSFNLQFIGEWTTFVNPDSVAKEKSAAAPTNNTAVVPNVVPVQESSVSDVF